jgi:hypothetical protein
MFLKHPADRLSKFFGKETTVITNEKRPGEGGTVFLEIGDKTRGNATKIWEAEIFRDNATPSVGSKL